MLCIHKGAEPACMVELRTTPGADWGSVHGTQKQAMRDAVYREQGGLCAYCMGRIKATHSDMKLEHWDARNASAAHVFAWSNLLGVCLGNTKQTDTSQNSQHCDTYRGSLNTQDQDLNYSPASTPNIETLVGYNRSTGDIRARRGLAADVAACVEDDIATLNLNHGTLQTNRAQVVGVLQQQLASDGSNSNLQRLYTDTYRRSRKGALTPYCGVARWYLRRKARSRNITLREPPPL